MDKTELRDSQRRWYEEQRKIDDDHGAARGCIHRVIEYAVVQAWLHDDGSALLARLVWEHQFGHVFPHFIGDLLRDVPMGSWLYQVLIQGEKALRDTDTRQHEGGESRKAKTREALRAAKALLAFVPDRTTDLQVYSVGSGPLMKATEVRSGKTFRIIKRGDTETRLTWDRSGHLQGGWERHRLPARPSIHDPQPEPVSEKK